MFLSTINAAEVTNRDVARQFSTDLELITTNIIHPALKSWNCLELITNNNIHPALKSWNLLAKFMFTRKNLF